MTLGKERRKPAGGAAATGHLPHRPETSEAVPSEARSFASRAHAVLAVRDLAQSTEFYELLTGMPRQTFGTVGDDRLARAMGYERILFRYASIELPNLRLVLREFDEPVPWHGAVEIVDSGNVHVCLEVEDLNAAVERIHRIGLNVNGPSAPAPSPHERAGTDRVVYVDGPDGEHVELVGTVTRTGKPT